MKKIDFKQIWSTLLIILVFAVTSIIYFYPAMEGKAVYAGDCINGSAAVQESVNFHKETGDYSYWTNGMFSGMPNYQIGGGGGFTLDRMLRPVRWLLSWGNRNAIFIFFYYLIAFFLLLRAFKVNRWLSMAGAFAIAMSSYFFVVVAAAHNGKCFSITWMTLVVVGFILTYQKKYTWGALLVMFFSYIGFYTHPQMSYYICMMIGMFWFAELVIAWKSKDWKHFGIATTIFFASFVVGIGMGSANFFANKEYAEETMRGGHSDLEKAKDPTNKTKGLDFDYATQWSYGIDETMTLLIPNFEGGMSGYNVGENSTLYKELTDAGVQRSAAKQFCKSAPTYRGDKPFTSGPVYIGAIVCLLFILGLLIVEGPYKWALLAATLFSITLAWGRHFAPWSHLFFDYFPAYNKFRAVESILIVAEITMPLLGFLALKTISEKKIEYKRLLTMLGIATGITGGICLIVALFAGAIDVTSEYDVNFKNQLPEFAYNAILAERTSMIRSDAWRSLLFVLMGAGLVYFYAKKLYQKSQPKATIWFGVALTVLILADLWTVDKRYCNNDMYVSKKEMERPFEMKPYEKELLQDKSHFRVLNVSGNAFNEARTSYYLKSIGGYSAAKLRRYQDLIDEHLVPEMGPLMTAVVQTQGQLEQCSGDSLFPVLNMLNMKYAIVPLQNNLQIPVENPHAMGNCWFVNDVQLVGNANDEIAALDHINLHTTAVADSAFADQLRLDQYDIAPLMAFDEDEIHLTKYTPKRIDYQAQNEQNRVAVFSEIYYPYGWHIYLTDGEGNLENELPLARVNYMLRAAVIPAGTHTLAMVFDPESVHKGNTLSLICFGIFCATLVAAIAMEIIKRKKAKTTIREK